MQTINHNNNKNSKQDSTLYVAEWLARTSTSRMQPKDRYICLARTLYARSLKLSERDNSTNPKVQALKVLEACMDTIRYKTMPNSPSPSKLLEGSCRVLIDSWFTFVGNCMYVANSEFRLDAIRSGNFSPYECTRGVAEAADNWLLSDELKEVHRKILPLLTDIFDLDVSDCRLLMAASYAYLLESLYHEVWSFVYSPDLVRDFADAICAYMCGGVRS